MRQQQIILIISAVVISCSLVYLGYFLGQMVEKVCQPEEQEVLTAEELGAGNVGEIGETPLVTPTMPPAIFSTAGTITEIKTDRLIIRGEGTNFADGVPRTLSAVFTDTTITFNKNQSFYWQGKEGLRHLQQDAKILISSSENIRGKTEFKAKIVNAL